MSEMKYRIRFENEELGSFTLAQLMRMNKRGEFDFHAEYWSSKVEGWRRIAGIMNEEYPPRLLEMKEAGIECVEISLSGNGDDCPSCTALSEKVYPIDEVPEVPPWDCSCEPWCRCIIVARQRV